MLFYMLKSVAIAEESEYYDAIVISAKLSDFNKSYDAISPSDLRLRTKEVNSVNNLITRYASFARNISDYQMRYMLIAGDSNQNASIIIKEMSYKENKIYTSLAISESATAHKLYIDTVALFYLLNCMKKYVILLQPISEAEFDLHFYAHCREYEKALVAHDTRLFISDNLKIDNKNSVKIVYSPRLQMAHTEWLNIYKGDYLSIRNNLWSIMNKNKS